MYSEMQGLMNKDKDTDLAELVGNAQLGDRAAFDCLVARTRDDLRATIGARIGNHLRGSVEIEDILQETYMRALQAIGNFRYHGPQSFLQWLRSIAEHALLEGAKRQRRDPILQIDREAQASDVSPSRDARRAERFARLQRALDELSEDHRQVVYLARIEGLKIREIAARMNRSPSAIGNLLLRAMKQLKTSFGDTESLHLPDGASWREDESDARRGE